MGAHDSDGRWGVRHGCSGQVHHQGAGGAVSCCCYTHTHTLTHSHTHTLTTKAQEVLLAAAAAASYTHKHTHTHTHTYTHTHTHTPPPPPAPATRGACACCGSVGVCGRACMRVCVRVHLCVFSLAPVLKHLWCVCVQMCVRACVCVRARVRACVRACVRAPAIRREPAKGAHCAHHALQLRQRSRPRPATSSQRQTTRSQPRRRRMCADLAHATLEDGCHGARLAPSRPGAVMGAHYHRRGIAALRRVCQVHEHSHWLCLPQLWCVAAAGRGPCGSDRQWQAVTGSDR